MSTKTAIISNNVPSRNAVFLPQPSLLERSSLSRGTRQTHTRCEATNGLNGARWRVARGNEHACAKMSLSISGIIFLRPRARAERGVWVRRRHACIQSRRTPADPLLPHCGSRESFVSATCPATVVAVILTM